MSHIEETNRAMEKQLEEARIRDVTVAVLCGVAFGAMLYLLLGPGGTTSSGGISPTITTQEGRPWLGVLAGAIGAVVAARTVFTQIRQRRRRRFWGL